MNIEILYEDEYIVAIHKPAGMVVHDDGRTEEVTVVDWLKEHVPDIGSVGEPIVGGEELDRTGIVHRIDRDTSGVLVLTKTQDAYTHLKQQFHDRQVKKVYRAFVYGSLREARGMIDRPIARSKTDFRKWTAQSGKTGTVRDAVTYFKTLKQTRDVSYVELRPKTGRTHQIRVHMKAIHHPVVCDSVYAKGKPSLLGFSRLALHAQSITLTLPNGEPVSIEAPLPADFVTAEKEIARSTG